ncbi:MAG: InlB B-repeat-containing protein, partial [Bacteroidaceae bacterium]|nr:InlB B-repeat-containing protein [Bacteroidaceae bacterium]
MMRTLINKKILTLIGLLFNVFITTSLWAEDHVGVVVGTTSNANEWKIDVSLENLESSNYTAFQMDLVLPDGVRVQENTIEASSRLAHHTLTTKLQDDGTLRLAAYSLNNTAITGNTSSLVSLLVTLDNATQSGTFLARLTNVRFSKRNGVETTFPDASCEWNYTYIPTYTLTYMVDDEVYDSQTWYAGETIAPIAAPEKEGHTFVEWDNLPATMPEQDVVAKARYKVNKYLLTFMINDETIVSDSVEYGAAITVPDAAVKEGHIFSGWQNVPETMPAQDVVVTGSYILNKYLLTFKIGDEILRADSVLYGATVTAPDAAVKEGHTFSGWHNVPETMPAQDVVVTGDYLVNKYLLTFKIGDEIISSDSVFYGTTIVAPDAPVKEGLKFSGWYNLPTTMPAHDVTITGSYADRFYLLTFKIGDEVLASDSVAYGAEIIAPVAPGLEGHTFNGWQNVPATMPAHDLVITGAYHVNRYLLTFKIGDEVFSSDSVSYGATIIVPEVSAKEGHTFSGWQNVPETMPAQDVVVTGAYSVNKYLITFKIGDEVISSDSVSYGASITVPEVTAKEGHTFSGWQNVPATMPAQDVVVTGAYSVNKYLITFVIGDEVISSDSLTYGATITAPEAAVKEGHTFSGWQDVPATMPAQDVVVTGAYSVNKYLITFKIGDRVVVSDSLSYGSEIVPPTAPERLGSTFNGWTNLPQTMPDHDVMVTGSYSVNKYLVTFMIGDEIVATDSVLYGVALMLPEVPEKEGHTFNGWENVPSSMPAQDIIITGRYSVNKYLLTFVIGDEVISSDSLVYGATVEAPEVSTKEGYTFSGWQNVPATMPAQDVVVTGAYSVNKYLITFVIGDDVISSDSLAYGASIIVPEAKDKEGYTFGGWQNVPATMPAQDVVVTGAYSVNKYLLTFKIGDEVISSDSLAYGASIIAPEAKDKEGYTFSGWQ